MKKTMDKSQYFGFIEVLVENYTCTRLSTFHRQYAQKRTLHAQSVCIQLTELLLSPNNVNIQTA